MTIKNLKAGLYTATFTNPDFETLSAEIEVKSTGVSCLKVTGGLCGSTTPPGINTVGVWGIFGTLKPIAVAKGYLSVSSSPIGASIDVNGIDIGKTPVTRKEVSIGSKLVTLRLSGYTPAERSVTIVDGETTELMVSLTLIPVTKEGFLSVTSVPTGASVSIGGVSIGSTPLSAYGIPAGAKVVTISKEGYTTKTQDVVITAGETSTVDVVLEEAVVPVGFEGWIEKQGGIPGMDGNLSALMELMNGYLAVVNLGFVVTLANVMSGRNYYLGVA